MYGGISEVMKERKNFRGDSCMNYRTCGEIPNRTGEIFVEIAIRIFNEISGDFSIKYLEELRMDIMEKFLMNFLM